MDDNEVGEVGEAKVEKGSRFNCKILVKEDEVGSR